MTELLTAAQMKAIEQAAIEAGEVTGLELMERAGRGVVAAIFEEWPELAPSWGPTRRHCPSDQWRDNSDPPEFIGQDDKGHRAVVLCGPGNNGGDGFVVARLLKEAGWDVEVFLYGDAEKLPPDARVNYERWSALGVVYPMDDSIELLEYGLRSYADLHRPDLYVDAIFGGGLSRPIAFEESIGEEYVGVLGGVSPGAEMWPYSSHKVCAIDVPSGLCADSGRVLSPDNSRLSILADLTVTFERPRVGHMSGNGPDYCGKITVVELGISAQAKSTIRKIDTRYDPIKKQKSHMPSSVKTVDLGFVENHFDWLKSDRRAMSLIKGTGHSHKYSHGHALFLSGGVGKGGAARLAARGALRVGAGAVTVGCPPAAVIENAAQLNAIMLRAVKGVDRLGDVLSDDRINALCMGPGMGVSDESRDLIEAGLKSGRAIVLDADALTLIGRDVSLFAFLHEKCVLTPHAGEFARLFPDISEQLTAPATKGPAYSKVDATREAAKRAGCVVLFKGPDTVIADPKGRCSINASVYERSAPWLATAGSGDVLAGFITGLMARGFAPMQAAETGAWLHTECALSFGPGLIAEDLPEELPKVFRALGI